MVSSFNNDIFKSFTCIHFYSSKIILVYNFIFSFRLGSLVTVASSLENYPGPYNYLKCCIFPFGSPGWPEPRFDHHAPSVTEVKELTQSTRGRTFKIYLKDKTPAPMPKGVTGRSGAR